MLAHPLYHKDCGTKPFLCRLWDSSDLNPIENFFSKLKYWLRKAAERTIDTVCDAIAHTLKTVTPTECDNYFLKAGYEQT